ncbi:hypothetical protein [Actinocorallia libanotica]|uniref:hypothetical protein n=1 Tax=Actinocorallia libanotica TaxID=46162 RepID=UPI0031DF02F4
MRRPGGLVLACVRAFCSLAISPASSAAAKPADAWTHHEVLKPSFPRDVRKVDVPMATDDDAREFGRRFVALLCASLAARSGDKLR